jgi:hypothetical protein
MNLETQYESLQVAHDLPALLGGLLPVLLAHRGELLAVKDAGLGRYVHVNEAMAQFPGQAGRRSCWATPTRICWMRPWPRLCVRPSTRRWRKVHR